MKTSYHTPLFQSRRSTADGRRSAVPKHPGAELSPSKIVTIGALFTLKGGKFRHFHRWLKGEFSHLFPHLLAAHQLAAPACDTS